MPPLTPWPHGDRDADRSADTIDRVVGLELGADGYLAKPFDRSIDIRIVRLRRKVETVPERPESIKTVRNAGYIFVPGL